MSIISKLEILEAFTNKETSLTELCKNIGAGRYFYASVDLHDILTDLVEAGLIDYRINNDPSNDIIFYNITFKGVWYLHRLKRF